MDATEETKQQEAFDRFTEKLKRSVDIRQVEYATAQDYETPYTPSEYEIIIRVTTAPIEKMNVIETADTLRQHIIDQIFSVDGRLIESKIPPPRFWHTKAPIFYFAVSY